MSRIGKRAIPIPAKTDVSADHGVLTVKGPGGELTKDIHSFITIRVENGEVTVTPVNNTKLARALWGTYASHVRNMLKGVTTPYEKKLILDGVGYRIAVQGTDVVLNVGFSHPVKLPIPKGITVSVEKNETTVKGADKEVVGQFAAHIRKVKPPEPYKGKGFHYSDETILRKQGKKASK